MFNGWDVIDRYIIAVAEDVLIWMIA